jgi:hypothetical protein
MSSSAKSSISMVPPGYSSIHMQFAAEIIVREVQSASGFQVRQILQRGIPNDAGM